MNDVGLNESQTIVMSRGGTKPVLIRRTAMLVEAEREDIQVMELLKMACQISRLVWWGWWWSVAEVRVMTSALLPLGLGWC